MKNEDKAKNLALEGAFYNTSDGTDIDIKQALYNCAMQMAEWKEKQMVEKACDAYCRICDTQECFNDGNCNWVEKFRKAIKNH